MKHTCRSLNLLVVEDETILSMELECILEDFGHVVVAAAGNLDAALSTIESERYNIDAALVDANLGGKSSRPIVERLRECDIPCLVVSGYSSAELKDMGFTEPVLEKPYDAERLKRALAEL
jgi:DNA-binding response OmpR family regulator